MKVRVEARAPTTPPDMGASTKRPEEEEWTALAMSVEEVGSMVEQSMKRRSVSAEMVSEIGGRRGCKIWPKTDLT